MYEPHLLWSYSASPWASRENSSDHLGELPERSERKSRHPPLMISSIC